MQAETKFPQGENLRSHGLINMCKGKFMSGQEDNKGFSSLLSFN